MWHCVVGPAVSDVSKDRAVFMLCPAVQDDQCQTTRLHIPNFVQIPAVDGTSKFITVFTTVPEPREFSPYAQPLPSQQPLQHNVQLAPSSWGGERDSISRRTSVLTTSGHLRTAPSTEYVIQSFLFQLSLWGANDYHSDRPQTVFMWSALLFAVWL
jgi:hypothetical protein